MGILNKLVSLFGLFISAAGLTFAQESSIPLPEIHGAIRGRYEVDTHDGYSRFQVRNARVSIGGQIAPVIRYFIQIDACDRGKMKFLDAWGRFDLTKGLYFQAGQFRQPFGIDNFLAPANYIFANRSFIGKTINNFRGVGAKVCYTLTPVPLTLEAGVFNSTSIDDHEIWTKKPAFASKAVWRAGNWMFATGYQSNRRADIRMNYLDGTISWSNNDWKVEGEYMSVSYTGQNFPTCHSYNFFINKGFDVKAGVFNRASLQGRFDGMTKHSNGTLNDLGELTVTNPPRNRFTAGGTLTYSYKSVHADLRLNFEKYWYHSDYTPAVGQGDKIVAEMVIRF